MLLWLFSNGATVCQFVYHSNFTRWKYVSVEFTAGCALPNWPKAFFDLRFKGPSSVGSLNPTQPCGDISENAHSFVTVIGVICKKLTNHALMRPNQKTFTYWQWWNVTTYVKVQHWDALLILYLSSSIFYYAISTLLHSGGKYCTFYSATFIW